ncbi:MAG: hypothetical protein JWM16_4545, partial [Verrucomicrobiales bacterium]|nr:hypothetical protein [Verrucomicrobiales bacterium]
ADDIHVVAFHERLAEVCRQRGLLRRHRKELEKDVRTNDDKHQTKQNADDNGQYFHGLRITGLWINSILRHAGGGGFGTGDDAGEGVLLIFEPLRGE